MQGEEPLKFWGGGAIRKRGWGKIHSENKSIRTICYPFIMSALSLWNYLSCRIRLSPKTAEALSEGCAPILPLQSPSPGQAPLHHAALKPSPLGPANPACAQPTVLLFTLASMHLDFVFLAQHKWRGRAVTVRRVQLAFLSLLPPGEDPSVKLQE